MGTIALFISLLFSTILILRDCKNRKGVSAAVWIPTVLVMVISSRPITLWLVGKGATLGVENANDQGGSLLEQGFYFSILFSSLVIATKRGMKWGRLLADNKGILLFYLYFAISICWSSDPTGSIKRIIKDFGMLFVAGVIQTEKNPFQAMMAVFVRSAYLFFPLSVVFIKYLPWLGRIYSIEGGMMFTGVTTERNLLGEIVMIYSLFMIWDFLERRRTATTRKQKRLPWGMVLIFLNGLWLLRISQSKTALMCAVVSCFLLFRGKALLTKATNKVIFAGALFVPLAVYFSARFAGVLAPLVQALGRNMTFTGRTDIWTHITASTVNPLIGAGYYNFWGGPGGYAVNQAMRSVIPNAHNGYVDLYLDGGFIGLTMLALLLISGARSIMKRTTPDGDPTHYHRLRFAILVAAIIYNISESTFARVCPIWFTFLLMTLDYRPLIAAADNAVKTVRQRRNDANIHPAPTLVTY